MTRTMYRVEFLFNGRDYHFSVPPDVYGIEDFSGGFWVDRNFQFTKGSDCRFWVPPHAIKYIAKDRVGA